MPDKAPPVLKPVPVQLDALVEDHVSVTEVPLVTDVALAESDAVGGFDAVTWVHGVVQLSPSLDSVITEALSAHALTYQVAAEVKVYERVALVLPPEASAEALWVPMLVVFEPDESVARLN